MSKPNKKPANIKVQDKIEVQREPQNIEAQPEVPAEKQSFFKKYKDKIIKLTIVAFIVAGFSIGCFFLFKALGLLDAESAVLSSGGFWIYIIFVVLFVVQSLGLCMIPGNTTTFITLAGLIFGDFWVAFLICVIGVWLGGILLFFVGRFAGRGVLFWLFGKEEVNKKLAWVTRKGVGALPAFFLIPFMPNDMICMVSGMSKIKFWQFLIVIIPFRLIEVLIILSYPLIAEFFVSGRPIQDILILINVLIIDVLLIALYYKTVVRVFRKTILRKKYVAVEKPYTVLQEINKKS